MREKFEREKFVIWGEKMNWLLVRDLNFKSK